jgi:predicted Zn-dependent protease
MRLSFFLALLGAVFFATSHWYVQTAAICPVPIAYRIGTIDERFGVSPEELQQIVTDAEAVWENSVATELFVYDETTDFTINFIYDERQQLALTEEEWRIALDSQQTKHEALLEEIKTLGARYQTEEASYNTRRQEYEAKLAAYNAEVEKYNDEGGAPPEVFTRLQAEKQSLNELLRSISKLEVGINELADAINRRGEEGNEKIAAYNAEVEEYNEIFGTLDTFTQGDYKRERINVYKFTDAKELTQVIAHEFGHALGVGHVEGEESVMYYLMTDREFATLSPADKAALVAECGDTQSLDQQVRRIIRDVLTKFN